MGWGAEENEYAKKKKTAEGGEGSFGSSLLNAANSRPSQAPAHLISFLPCSLCSSLFVSHIGDRNKTYETREGGLVSVLSAR